MVCDAPGRLSTISRQPSRLASSSATILLMMSGGVPAPAGTTTRMTFVGYELARAEPGSKSPARPASRTVRRGRREVSMSDMDLLQSLVLAVIERLQLRPPIYIRKVLFYDPSILFLKGSHARRIPDQPAHQITTVERVHCRGPMRKHGQGSGTARDFPARHIQNDSGAGANVRASRSRAQSARRSAHAVWSGIAQTQHRPVQ